MIWMVCEGCCYSVSIKWVPSSLTADVTCTAATFFCLTVPLPLFLIYFFIIQFSDWVVLVDETKMLEVDRATVMISTTLSIGLGIAIGWALRGRTSAAKAIKKTLLEDVSFLYFFVACVLWSCFCVLSLPKIVRYVKMIFFQPWHKH